jgi:hypothetical protein
MTTTLNASTAGAGGFIATSDNSGSLALQTAGTTAITVDASQNVGINTTSPSYKLDVQRTANNGTGILDVLRLRSTGDNVDDGPRLLLTCGNSTTGGAGIGAGGIALNSAYLAFYAGGNTERARIDTSGRFGFGTSSIVTGSTQGMFTSFKTTGSGTFNFGPNSTGSYVVFSGTTGVYLDAGNTSWSSTSDERVKENLIPIANGLTKVASLRAVTGNFIDDEAKKSRAFLIAQDVQAVLPEAISIQKDEQQTLGVQYTDVIPLLVASIKELKAINDTQAETLTQQTEAINALTARIVAIESRGTV